MVKRKTGDGVSQHLVTTPARLKREKNKRQREEDEWASKAGPVVTRVIRPRPGDLEAAMQPHAFVLSGELVGASRVEVCDLCGLAQRTERIHPE
jgi:hypothetical protein